MDWIASQGSVRETNGPTESVRPSSTLARVCTTSTLMTPTRSTATSAKPTTARTEPCTEESWDVKETTTVIAAVHPMRP